MKSYKIIYLLLVLLLFLQIASAQSSSDIKKKVEKKLNELKPPETEEFKYKIVVPEKVESLPHNLHLDISYKIGHYEYQYVALRFEREISSSDVIVTKFAYGSALAFWKEYAKRDSFIAMQGKISTADFENLLNLAQVYYKSDIEKIYKTSGYGRGSGSGSSSDGIILINLSDSQNIFQPIIEEYGTLHSGTLKSRISNGYDDLRVHIFWKVFYDYLKKNDIFTDLENSKAETIAISRLQEPQAVIGQYAKYYRLSAYIQILGEIGTGKSIPVLKKVAQENELEKDWNSYLTQKALEAIKKIKIRKNSTAKN